MNRREMLTSIAAGTAAAGVTGATVKTMEAGDEKPALAVIEVPGHITPDVASYLKATLEAGLTGTVFEGIRILVLPDGLTLKFLDQSGAERLPKDVIEA